MITGFFLAVFYVLLVAVTSLFPAVSLPSAWATSFALLWGYFSSFSFLFPMPTVLAVLLLALSFHVALLLFDFTLWVIHLLRGR